MTRAKECRTSASANPKANELIKILREHFARYKEAGQQTSVIVFTQFRTSVCELVDAITRNTDLTASPFVGQSNTSTKSKSKGAPQEVVEEESVAITGQNQKQQQEVVRRFRNNEIDVLVATSIGEEGLDIGSVDLIIAFDALASPVRMIQRFGRAGRKRSGKVICLVAEGKEKDTLTSGTAKSQRVHNLLRKNPHRLFLYQQNPRMLPGHGCPVIHNFRFEIRSFRSSQIAGRSRGGKPKKAAGGTKTTESNTVASLELSIKEKQHFLQNLKCDKSFMFNIADALARPNIEHLRNHHVVGHSSRTLLLKRLLDFITEESNGAKEWLDVPYKEQECEDYTDVEFVDVSEAPVRLETAPADLAVKNASTSKQETLRFDNTSMLEVPKVQVYNQFNTADGSDGVRNSPMEEHEDEPPRFDDGDNDGVRISTMEEREDEPPRFDDDFAAMSADEYVSDENDNGSLFGDIIPHPPGIGKTRSRGKCTVCGSFSEKLLACVDCGICVHAECVDSASSSTMWRCDICMCLSKSRNPTCELCTHGRRHGVMKADDDSKRWVHISCAVWSAGALCSFGGTGVKHIKIEETKGSKERKCCFCGQLGCCAVCSDPCCTETYHASCGIKAGLRFKFDRIYPTSLCKTHSEAASLRAIDEMQCVNKSEPENTENDGNLRGSSAVKEQDVLDHNVPKDAMPRSSRASAVAMAQEKGADVEQVIAKHTPPVNLHKIEPKQQKQLLQAVPSSLATPVATNDSQGPKPSILKKRGQTTSSVLLSTPIQLNQPSQVVQDRPSTIIKAPEGAAHIGRRRRNVVESDSESAEEQHKEASEGKTGEWTCKRCTLVNWSDDNTCQACGMRRQSSRKINDGRRTGGDEVFREEKHKKPMKRKKRKLKRARSEKQQATVKASFMFEQEAEVSGDDSGDGDIVEDLDQDLEGFVVEDGEGEDCSESVNNIYRRSLVDSSTPTPRLLKRGRAMCIDMPVIANELKRMRAQASNESPVHQVAQPTPQAVNHKSNRPSFGASQRDSLGQSIRQRIEQNKRKALERRQRKALVKQQQREASPPAIDLTQSEQVPRAWCREPNDGQEMGEFGRCTLQRLLGTAQDMAGSVQPTHFLQGADIILGTRCCVILCEASECLSGGIGDRISQLRELYKDIVIVARIGQMQLGQGDLVKPYSKGCRLLLVGCADDAVNAVRRIAAKEEEHGFGLCALDVDRIARKCSQSTNLGAVMKFLCTARGMNVVVICCMIKSFNGKSLGEMVAQMKAKVLMQAAPGLTSQQAALITSYFTRRCRA